MTRPAASEIRQQFVDFFVEKCGHTLVCSSPCVPLDDPTLMFTNAGMNQFKDVFLATGTRPYRRAVNTQKCIRAGGKHNDLDDVGHDTYHHTFFEMLGNWSFGDYFKKEAIEWAWELLTGVWGMDKTRLHATYFQGDPAEGLEPDTEAAELWKSATDIDPAHVHPGDKKDNFWEMGEVGPCGPCSEIHIDLTPDKSGAKLVNAGDPRVMELWNLVFIQFNRVLDRKLTPLPAKHVDTGMGFERLCAVLQGVDGNYETDVFTPIFDAIQRVTGAPAYTGLLEDRDNTQYALRNPQVMVDVAYRVIADHLRCLTIALTDGAMPDKKGRGYVLRRILRRAARYGRQYLDTREPFIFQLVPAVVDTMGGAFPELNQDPERVTEIIRQEEASFGKTLDRGIVLFAEAADYAVKHTHGWISGEDAFKLHDTYGFPIDLTKLMAEELGLTVNMSEYEQLTEQPPKPPEGPGTSEEDPFERVSPEEMLAAGPCDDSPKYETLECGAMVTLADHGSQPPGSGTNIVFMTNRTCFYPEQGGQVSDVGIVETDTGRIEVKTVRQRGDRILYSGEVMRGTISVGQQCQLRVDPRRRQTMMNHTATHMMNWALREVLGDHVQQEGSLVDPEKTRFDLSHHAQITNEQLARIEGLVNKMIDDDLLVCTEEVELAKAREINTLRAVFGEKYPDVVRVISIGRPVRQMIDDPKNAEWMKYSVEFCGGTHLKHTGEVGRFRLIEESAVGTGKRRVTAVTGERARKAEDRATAMFRQLKDADRADDAALPQQVAELAAVTGQAELPILDKLRMQADLAKLQERAKKIQKQVARAGTANVIAQADELLACARKVDETLIVVGHLREAAVEQLRAACDSLRARAGSAAVFLAAEKSGKVLLLAAVTPDVAARGIKAGDLVRAIAPIVGGKGGGKSDIAQGGGSKTARIPDAIREAEEWLRGKLAPAQQEGMAESV